MKFMLLRISDIILTATKDLMKCSYTVHIIK